jgi:hypothetical protein
LGLQSLELVNGILVPKECAWSISGYFGSTSEVTTHE